MTLFKVGDLVQDRKFGDVWRVVEATTVGDLEIYDVARILPDGTEGELFKRVLLGSQYVLKEPRVPTDAQVELAAHVMYPNLFAEPGENETAGAVATINYARAELIERLRIALTAVFAADEA